MRREEGRKVNKKGKGGGKICLEGPLDNLAAASPPNPSPTVRSLHNPREPLHLGGREEGKKGEASQKKEGKDSQNRKRGRRSQRCEETYGGTQRSIATSYAVALCFFSAKDTQ